MIRERLRRAGQDIIALAGDRLDWVTFPRAAGDLLAGIVPFSRSCWHTVDPGTVLFTGSLNQNIVCSGTWLVRPEPPTGLARRDRLGLRHG